MADTKHSDHQETLEASQTSGEAAEQEQAEKLQLEVNVESRGACQRHITVKVSRGDIDRFFAKEFTDLMPTAQVPGFRAGRAPRKLVENRFRKQVADKVKGELLMACLSQVQEEQKLSAISEPDVDLDAVELPDEGPMTFEFGIEVRPDFEMPKWKGLKLDRPAHEITKDDIDAALRRSLMRLARLTPVESPAQAEDFVTVNLTSSEAGKTLKVEKDLVLRVRPTLSLRDANVADFLPVLLGAKAGDVRETQAVVSADAANEALRGKTIDLKFEVLEVKRIELPAITPELLQEVGGFECEADLRDALKDSLERRLQYEQRRIARRQITEALTAAADWELPPDLLKRQSRRELQRLVMELQRSGFSDDEIRAHENELLQNSRVETARALKEHFILERIAEDEGIEAEEADFDTEIALIAAQTGEAPRRVRARLEKAGSMDVLHNQVIERKVVEKILEAATFQDAPFEFEKTEGEAVNVAVVAGDEVEIPEAKEGGGEPLPNRP